jgi:hypothetical protein
MAESTEKTEAGSVPTDAQPPASDYTPVTGSTSTSTPTSEVEGPYAPVAIPTTLGGQAVPDTAHTEQQPSASKAGESGAEQEQVALNKLSEYFGFDYGQGPRIPLGPSLLEQVTQALAIKYNVQLFEPGSVGSERVKSQPTGAAKRHKDHGEAPAVRNAVPETEDTSTSATPNKKALAQIAAKMGIQLRPGENPLVAIAGIESSGGSGSQNPLLNIPGETAAQNYSNFVQQGFNAKTGALTSSGKQWEDALIQAGYLDVNANLGTPTANEVQNAYLSLLNVAVNGQKTGDPHTTVAPGQGIQAAIAAGQNIAKATDANAPGSEAYATVQGVASEFGVYLSPLQITDIANKFAGQITAEGSPADVENSIKDLVIQQYNPNNPNDPAGIANTMYTDIQQSALQYQIPISPDQLNAMVKNGLQTASVAYPASAATDVQNKAIQQFQEQAAGLYPTLAAQIKAGNTVQNLVAPYYNVAESYTGVPATTMMSEATTAGGPPSKWGVFLQGGNTPGNGVAPNSSGSTKGGATPQGGEGAGQLMTIDQWKQKLMTDPIYGFDKTQGAKDMAEQMSSAILNELGRVNTDGGSQSPFGAYNPSSALQANTT